LRALLPFLFWASFGRCFQTFEGIRSTVWLHGAS
jgi:hypothetical protein